MTLGATVVNIASANAQKASRSNPGHHGRQDRRKHRFRPERPADAAPGQQWQQSVPWSPPGWPAQGYVVTTTLLEGDREIDCIRHQIHVLDLSGPKYYVTTGDDGHFHLDGKLWRANGINFRPDYFIAAEGPPFYDTFWADNAAYDPEIAGRDLENVAKLGFNAISIGIKPADIGARNLLDTLRMARDLHLHVNVALIPGMPYSFVPDDAKKMIGDFHLADDDTIFAYDIAWEPEFRGYKDRVKLDPAWRDWVGRRYGSVDAAKAAWGITAPIDSGGLLTSPSDDQASAQGGAVSLLLADYRRFLDDWEAHTYGPVVDMLHGVDTHHYVSFRMSHAGDPLDSEQHAMPYQFQGLAKTVDFLSPEGYGNPGGDDGLRAGCFELAYARSSAPSKPVLWAEYGRSAWFIDNDTPDSLDEQGRFIRDFYKMSRQGGADGLFVWFYPGGFRTGEWSDYGIVNPDGTDRAATTAIREEGKLFLDEPLHPAPSTWLDYDRFTHPNDVYGIYREIGDKFWSLVQAGNSVGLRQRQ